MVRARLAFRRHDGNEMGAFFAPIVLNHQCNDNRAPGKALRQRLDKFLGADGRYPSGRGTGVHASASQGMANKNALAAFRFGQIRPPAMISVTYGGQHASCHRSPEFRTDHDSLMNACCQLCNCHISRRRY